MCDVQHHNIAKVYLFVLASIMTFTVFSARSSGHAGMDSTSVSDIRGINTYGGLR